MGIARRWILVDVIVLALSLGLKSMYTYYTYHFSTQSFLIMHSIKVVLLGGCWKKCDELGKV